VPALEVSNEIDDVTIELFTKLRKDIQQSAAGLTRRHARWVVDMYYCLQDERIRAAGQKRASAEGGEPYRLVEWIFTSMRQFESGLKSALGEFAKAYAVGRWLQAQYGIGPVISAGLLSHFDIAKAPTVGHMWRFAGLDPTCKWLGKTAAEELVKSVVGDSKTLTQDMATAIKAASGQHEVNAVRVFNEGFRSFDRESTTLKKGAEGLISWLSVRPYNAKLKAICAYRMGECFVKFSGRDECFYGQLYAKKKAELTARNEAGEYRELAAQYMKERRRMKGSPTWGHWKEGKLRPLQVHERARRWAVKLFLSHLHRVMYVDYHGTEPPAPFIFQHPELGDHRHLIDPPLWPHDYGGKPLRGLAN